MAKKKTVETTATIKPVVSDKDKIIDQLADIHEFKCRHDDDGYTLSRQHELMDMRIYFNKNLDLVRFTTHHTYETIPEYITAKNIFFKCLCSILEVISDDKNDKLI